MLHWMRIRSVLGAAVLTLVTAAVATTLAACGEEQSAATPMVSAPAAATAETGKVAEAAPALAAPAQAAPAAAEQAQAAAPQARVITVTGVGTAGADPDVVDITLGVESIKPDAAVAIGENTELMTAVMAVLKEMGIAEQDIQTVSYSMWVQQVYGEDGPTGELIYHVTNQVRIRMRDLSKTGEVLQAALEAGANSVGGISFGVADTETLEREARDAAVDDARTRAEELAARLGVTLGGVRQVIEVSGVTPVPVPMAAKEMAVGAGAVPVSGGELTVTRSVQVVFDIAP